MMRKGAILLVLAGMTCHAFAATRVTVAKLEDLLEADLGKPDGKVARQLSKLELTERATSARLAQWQAEFPGGRTREELTELADASAFLALPAADISPAPAPDSATQHQLLAEAIDYAIKALTKLPNFYATRETTHFEDAMPPASFEQGFSSSSGRGARPVAIENVIIDPSEHEPLHKTGIYSADVQYRDGFEVAGPRGSKGRERIQEAGGLTTSGEFGPILYVVLKDGLAGTITWGHWERGAKGPLAVFLYTVPQADSHYMVQLQRAKGAQQVYPAYHGEIAVDPANGTIMRLTVVSDMMPPYQAAQAAILVEYAPVAIGERTYICPIKGVALSKMPVATSNDSELQNAPLQTQLNDVSFKDFHLFRGDTRILTGGAAGNDSAPAGQPASVPAVSTPSAPPQTAQ
jgi:hypothetical protein